MFAGLIREVNVYSTATMLALAFLCFSAVLALPHPPVVKNGGCAALSSKPVPHHENQGLFSGFASASPDLGNGTIVFGDMLFTPDSYKMWQNAGRSILLDTHWTKDDSGNTVIPYVIDDSIDPAKVPIIMAGISQWSNTCVKFVDNTEAQMTNFVKIIKPADASLCSSYFGNINAGSAGQVLNLGASCYSPDVVAHELGHAIGLSHEHNRADRDEFVVMFRNNVKPDLLHNFDIDGPSFITKSVVYNYLSVMHYFWNIFAIDKSLPTLMTKDPTKQSLLLYNNPVSHFDTLLVNRALDCSTLWAKSCTNPPVCVNFGYLDKNCQCACPPGTRGTTCETITAASLPEYPSFDNFQCGGKITEATTGISTPHFNDDPPGREAQADCIWWIQKPETANTAKVTFTAFNMYEKSTDGTCYLEFLEIRTRSLYIADGPRVCANDYVENSSISSSGDIVLWFQSNIYPNGNTGFKFDVSFD